jgi:hypothetical protein
MAWFDPRAVAHRRQMFTRHDAWRWAPPGSPEAKMPGWADPSATRVRLKAAQEEEARAREAAAQEEFERELLHLRREVKKLKLEHELWLFEQKYNPDQPRDDQGRWTTYGNGSRPPQAEGGESPENMKIAQAGFGTLIAQIPVPGGRRCVYNFGSYNVVVPGPTNLPCQPMVHWSGVVHGRLLNDN